MKHRFSILLVIAVFVWLVIEGISYLGLEWLDKYRNSNFTPINSELTENQKLKLQRFLDLKEGEKNPHDPVLGWTNSHEANSAGMRDDREYDRKASSGITRLSTFGDSFTYGTDVVIDNTWEKQLVNMETSLQVLNYGVGAYGLDQAYLRYLRVGTEYHPDVVLIGFMSENIERHVNVFRAFYTDRYRDVIFSKPRFSVHGGELQLIENPLSTRADYQNFMHNDSEVLAELGKHDYHYQIGYLNSAFDILASVRLVKMLGRAIKRRKDPVFHSGGSYNPESEAYQVTVKVIDAFYRKVLEDGALPVVLIFPDLNDQWSSRKNRERRYLPLLNDMQINKYRVIDLLGALEPYESQYKVKDLTERSGHYSALGNRIVAQYILKYLRQWQLLNPSTLGESVQVERKRIGIASP